MKAQAKRRIAKGSSYDHLVPKSIARDSVVVGGGKARLEDTLTLIQSIIPETKEDTARLAPALKGKNTIETCRNIWQFVYGHIQYKMDKTGVEQVRRPSRSWADRLSGVDCDCYTVFIGSILLNLGIPFKMRVTKYKGREHFQHIYPIVPTVGGYITLDCVTDRFNYEVPFSEKLDLALSDAVGISGTSGLCGVDALDIGLGRIPQISLPLREEKPGAVVTIRCKDEKQTKRNVHRRRARVVSPYRLPVIPNELKTSRAKERSDWPLLLSTGITLAAGYGVLRLWRRRKRK